MRRGLLLFYLLLRFSANINSQVTERHLSYYTSLLPADVVSVCNTAADVKDMSEEEKNAVLVTNLARTYPALFLKVIFHDYIQHSEDWQPGDPYVLSLQRHLEKLQPMQPLKVERVLNEVAFSHAEYCGKTGHIGHNYFEKRSITIQKKLKHDAVGENCSYGWETGLDFVMDLLIDEGVPSLGHRKNMLNSKFTSIGVSIQPFKDQGYCMVQMFSAP